ncbi:MAG: c-type cytochrome [Acetobacterales bacterium]
MSLGRIGLILVALALLGMAGAALFVRLGVYNVAATAQHTAPVFWLLQRGLEYSIRQRADGIAAPDLEDRALAERGFRHYHLHCVQCHGAPGVARHDLGKGMLPLPSNLVQTAREWTASEIFWTIKHGIKMSGMPGWDYRMDDDDIWAITAFVRRLPYVAPADYRAMAARLEADPGGTSEEGEMTLKGDPDRGQVAIRQYGCTACHTVPGVVGPNATVGPPLRGMATRMYIAGVLPNTPENMILWLRNPVEVDPLTGMPDLDVKAGHARDMAAYLETLD